jgi:hypothetical protein
MTATTGSRGVGDLRPAGATAESPDTWTAVARETAPPMPTEARWPTVALGRRSLRLRRVGQAAARYVTAKRPMPPWAGVSRAALDLVP